MRKTLIAITALAAVATFAVPAQAVKLLVNGTTPSVRWQRFVDKQMFVPTVRRTVALYLASRCPEAQVPDPAGCISGSSIWIAPGPAAATGETLRHELGHSFDFAYLTDAHRSTFTHIWSPAPTAPSGNWFGTAADYAWAARGSRARGQDVVRFYRIPAERFAETYATCSLYSSNAQITSAAMSAEAYDILRAPGWTLHGFVLRMRRSCTLIRDIGTRMGADPAARPRPQKPRTFDLK